MSEGSLNPKIKFLAQKTVFLTHTHIHRQTHTKVKRGDTLSGFQGFFLQPIIKDRSNITINCLLSRSACISILWIGENINICWSPDGSTIAVGNKDDLVTFIDARTHRSRAEEQFKFEVNEISWNNDGDLFFLTSGQGSIHIFRFVLCFCV